MYAADIGNAVRQNVCWRSAVALSKPGAPPVSWEKEGVLFQKEELMAKSGSSSVTLHLGATLKTGEFEFARIDIGVSEPCDKDKKNEAYAEARAFVTAKLEEEMKVIKEALAGKGA